MDYLLSVLLIAAPWLFDFSRGGAETWVMLLLGSGTILYCLSTDYEFGMFNGLPMTVHLTLDVVAGIFLAASPWIFGFNEYVHLPHVVLGSFEIALAMITRRTPAFINEGDRRRYMN